MTFDFSTTDPVSLSSLSVLVDGAILINENFDPALTSDAWTIRSGSDLIWEWDFLKTLPTNQILWPDWKLSLGRPFKNPMLLCR